MARIAGSIPRAPRPVQAQEGRDGPQPSPLSPPGSRPHDRPSAVWQGRASAPVPIAPHTATRVAFAAAPRRHQPCASIRRGMRGASPARPGRGKLKRSRTAHTHPPPSPGSTPSIRPFAIREEPGPPSRSPRRRLPKVSPPTQCTSGLRHARCMARVAGSIPRAFRSVQAPRGQDGPHPSSRPQPAARPGDRLSSIRQGQAPAPLPVAAVMPARAAATAVTRMSTPSTVTAEGRRRRPPGAPTGAGARGPRRAAALPPLPTPQPAPRSTFRSLAGSGIRSRPYRPAHASLGRRRRIAPPVHPAQGIRRGLRGASPARPGRGRRDGAGRRSVGPPSVRPPLTHHVPSGNDRPCCASPTSPIPSTGDP